MRRGRRSPLNRDPAKLRAWQRRSRERAAQRRRPPLARTGFGDRGSKRPYDRKARPLDDRKPPVPFNVFTERCRLARFDPAQRPCEGLVVRCHLVKEQTLRNRHGLTRKEAWHSDWWLPGCALHHDAFDNPNAHPRLVLERRDLPAELERRADADPMIANRLDLLYGPRERIAARDAA